MGEGLFKQIGNFYMKRYQEMAVPELAMERLSLEEMCRYLLDVPAATWGAYAFAREKMRDRLSGEQRETLAKQAAACGAGYAESFMEQYQTADPKALAKTLGLQVTCPETPEKGTQVLFAQFTEPDLIEVYQDCLTRADQVFRQEKIDELIEIDKIPDILLAHEIFHWIEMTHQQDIITRNTTVVLWKIKALENKAHVQCLSEIAAMSFAKELLGLEFWPYVLDVLLSYPYNPDAAHALFWEIRKRNEEKECKTGA